MTISRSQSIDVALLVLTYILGVYLNWEMHQIIISLAVVWQLVHPAKLDQQVLATVILLVLIPILTLLSRDIRANQTAVAAFAMLAVTACNALGIYVSGRRSIS